MSVAAVMMVRDEADVVGATIEHLLTQVDHVYVADNRSADGTTDIVRDFGEDRVSVTRDDEVAYEQSRKTTALAQWAARDGHEWIIPCDADEIWLAPEGQTISGFLAALPPDVWVAEAILYDHLPTSEDDHRDLVPQTRIRWRLNQPGPLPKVAVRWHPSLVIGPGNHDASYRWEVPVKAPGLLLHHFTWRDADQYLRKIRNGIEAYDAAVGIRDDLGVHWRMHSESTDAQIRQHFQTWFYASSPRDRPDLAYDPLARSINGELHRP